MRLAIEWSRPVLLRSGAREGLIYTLDVDRLERRPGIYVFARKWGKSFEALYVGRSNNIRTRIRGHLNNLRLMRHLENAKTGRRVVFAGNPVTRQGQQITRVLLVLERTLIRHFLAEGHDLVNQHGVRIRRHEIESSGHVPKLFVPSVMYLERARRE